MLFKICRKIALILTSLMVVQTEATLELRMFERADCLSTSWNTTKVIENLWLVCCYFPLIVFNDFDFLFSYKVRILLVRLNVTPRCIVQL